MHIRRWLQCSHGHIIVIITIVIIIIIIIIESKVPLSVVVVLFHLMKQLRDGLLNPACVIRVRYLHC